MLTEVERDQLTGGYPYQLEKVGGGFQGCHWRLKCRGGTYFVKAQQEGSYDTGAFVKEPMVYGQLLPAMGYHIGEKRLWPRLYFARKGLLVLEDLAAGGWVLEETFGTEHVKASLSALADFHASSMLLDDAVPVSENFRDALLETYFTPPALRTWEAFKRTARKIYTKYFPCRKWEEALRMMDETPEMVRPSTKFRNCVCHGDPWPNNIFFKYTNGVPVKACFVDFAQVRYCLPASDVLLFLRLLQVDDIDGYLLFYHSCLAANVPSFTLKEFLDSCVEMNPFALCVAPLYVYLTRLPQVVIERISKSPEEFMEFAMGKDAPALEAMEEDQRYRSSVIRTFKELLDFASKDKTDEDKLLIRK
ncbi:uncharacterized protein [Halyomorpha halys]|uniref:uncharacterized protein n=1 Tax=Halyomorpha halys TaxID=286706 RepID=UPI0006D50971|nr:uncharacterized protein LOC106689263 [Halyomorpha halys]KAE8573708.1 EcKinase 16 [Halyomorpha halys]